MCDPRSHRHQINRVFASFPLDYFLSLSFLHDLGPSILLNSFRSETPMNTHSQILIISRDRMLVQTRKLILGTYFEVEAAGRLSEARSILSKRDFDLIVLCDTLSNHERSQIADLVRDQQHEPILLSLRGPANQGEKLAVGRELCCVGGPLQLLKECANVLGVDLQTGSKQRSLAA